MNAFLISILVGWFVGLLWIIYNNLRCTWVFENRANWIREDLYDFKAHAPSFDTMMKKFWIWDMKKFGYDKERIAERKKTYENQSFDVSA